MRKLIAIALAKHMGEKLSPEVALDIARTLLDSVDCTPDPNRFAPIIFGKYRIACELMRDIVPELRILDELYHLEGNLPDAGIPFNPDYDNFLERECCGELLQYTSRLIETGELVGNMRVYLKRNMHTQTLIATEDLFYIRPEHRGGFMAVRLWQYVERCGIKLGIRECYINTKTANKTDKMAKYMGYLPVAIQYSKVVNHGI